MRTRLPRDPWHLHASVEQLEAGWRWTIQQPGDFWQGVASSRDEAWAIVGAAIRPVLRRRALDLPNAPACRNPEGN